MVAQHAKHHGQAVPSGLALTSIISQQRAILATLETILAQGQTVDAEPITWTLGYDGVTGKINADAGDRASARTTFDQWAHLIGAAIRPERTTSDGGTLLVASRRYRTGSHEHIVLLRLELPPADDAT
jgi:hypothetical protein